MKKLAPFLGIALSVWLAGDMSARNLVTTNGETFHNFELLAKEPTGLRLMHRDGVAFVDFMALADADRTEFGFDAAAYAAGRAQAEKIAAAKRWWQAVMARRVAILQAQKEAEAARGDVTFANRGSAVQDSSGPQTSASLNRSGGGSATVDTAIIAPVVPLGFTVQNFRTIRSSPLIIHHGIPTAVTGRMQGGIRGGSVGLSGSSFGVSRSSFGPAMMGR